MEIRKITKTDKNGKRLFIEVGKKMKKTNYLPRLKKGDSILLLPARELTSKQMESLLGKYVKFFDIDEAESYAFCFEGVIRKNDEKYWESEEKLDIKDKRYALIDPEMGAIDFFDDLNGVYDLQVIPGRERLVNKVNCWKCRKQFFEEYKFCPYCSKINRMYKKE